MSLAIKIILGMLFISSPVFSAGLLLYEVSEQGMQPYQSRILVTGDHVRLDNVTDTGNFSLYERASGILYNVSVDDETAYMYQAPSESIPVPEELVLSHEVKKDDAAPLIMGKESRQVSLLAQGVECRSLTVVPGLMQESLEGLKEMHSMLGRLKAARMADMPAGVSSNCDQAEYIYAADRYLDFGLPIQSSMESKRELLVNFDPDYQADEALFRLPENYEKRPFSP